MPRAKNQKRFQQLSDARASKVSRQELETTAEAGAEIEIEHRTCSASRKKIELMAGTFEQTETAQEQQWCIVHTAMLSRLVSDSLCPSCFQTGLTVTIQDKEHMGFASKLLLRCSLCGYDRAEYSSPRQNGCEKKNTPFEINRKMVLLSHEMGKGHAALETLGAVMGIPPMHLKTFQSHDRNVTAAEIEVGEEILQQSADTIRQAYGDVDPDLQEAMDSGLRPVVDISVTFDGTWMKRGFTSLYGVGVCIDILTGLVIDFHVLSKYCHACSQRRAQKPTDAEWDEWYRDHQPDCCINHTNSSKAMEQAAAEVIWGRSVEKFGLRYVEMLSDGDSSAFKAVCDLKPYGEDIAISKLECVNHAHKRLGTALRKLAKEERLGGKGVGRLTAAKCESLQKFYRGAIMHNLPDVRRMRSAVWAGLFHSMSTDKEPQHHQCPKGKDSWCFYQQALARGEPPPTHSQHPSHTFLTTSVAHKLIPLYRRMSDEALLSRMTHGGTQNTNECLNSTIWLRCPKTAFMGMRRVQGSVARAVAAFNEGARELVSVMNKMYVDISYITVEILGKKDQRRISKADSVSTTESRERRKQVATQHRLQIRQEEKKDGNVYGAGQH